MQEPEPDTPKPRPDDMKRDWNARARQNARWFIATSVAGSEPEFDASGARDVRLFFDQLEHLLQPDRVVLDIGCGIGRMDRHIAPRVRSLTGIDVSGEMVARARERLADLDNVRFVEGDGRTLAPLADRSFDLVFSHIVFQHVPRAVSTSYFAEAFRVLRPGGTFLFQMPGVGPGTPPDPPEQDSFEMRFWDEQDLRARLVAAGFHWRGCRRFPAGDEQLRFEQLRVHCERPPESDPGSDAEP